MMTKETHAGIPAEIKKNLAQRDQTPLSQDAWIKFQSISRMPGIAKNFRYLLMQDGRLFYAVNSREFPQNRAQVFNTPLPDQPSRILSKQTMDDIRSRLDETDYFSQPVYQTTQTRDGSLVIVTVRHGAQVHEVWYENVHTSLTDYLHGIGPDAPVVSTPEQEISDLQEILAEQRRLADSLEKEPPDQTGNESGQF